MNDLWRYSPVTGHWTWMSGANVVNQYGVYGTRGTPDPANVPGGVNIGFSADYSAGRDGGAANGIDAAGEYLTILATLSGSNTYADVVSAMNTGALRTALHVQSIGMGDLSASYVVGDRYLDLDTGFGVGARGLLVLTGYGKGEYAYRRDGWPRSPDHVAENLERAVDWIL